MILSLLPSLFAAGALLAASPHAGSSRSQAPVIEISGANFRPLPLAVPLIAEEGVDARQGNEFDRTLFFDLSAAGIFQVLDRKGYLADRREGMTAESIQFSRWSDVGAEALVKTQLRSEGGSLRAELRLFTVGSGREELKVTESAPAKDVRRLAHTLADAVYRHFTREPGPFRSRLAFVRRSERGKDVWISDWDGGNAQAVTSGSINVLPAIGPDGQSVAFTSYRNNKPELWFQRLGGQPTSLVQSGQMATGVAYSPDGKRIAYSLAQGEGAQIWVARADGSEAKAITDTRYFINSSPSWSPDGKKIAFVSNRGGTPQVYTMTADGREVRRLTFQGTYNQTPDWSPRGDLIAFTARDERNAFDLFTVNLETGKVVRLTQGAGNNEEPTFSPNGRLIIFSSNRTGSPQLFVMTAEGNNPLPLPATTERGGGFATPDWGTLARD